jgi:hypothetical protein
MSSHPNRETASMLHKDMILGDCVIRSSKFLCNGFSGLIKPLHVGIAINPTNVFANNVQV